MKMHLVFLVGSLYLGLTGCSRGSHNIGDASRTETLSLVAGWKDVSTSGVTLQLPTDWKAIDFSTAAFEKGADKVFGNDPRFASLRSQASAMAKQGMVKLFAFDMSTVGRGFNTNCNVIVQELPGQPTIEQVAAETARQIAPMVASGTSPKMEYAMLKPGKSAIIWSEIRSPNPSIPALVSIAYLSVKGSKIAGVTFTAPLTDETRLRTIAKQAMSAFRFTD